MDRQYISGSRDCCTRDKHVAAPLLRRCFTYDIQDRKEAYIEISAAGFYRLFLNGEELTRGFFSPYISNPDGISYFDRYDVTGKLAAENTLCILLGNGFNNAMDSMCWEFEAAPFRSAPKVYLGLFAGGERILTTDEQFSVCDSPITFDDLRCGEHFDARKCDPAVLRFDYPEDACRKASPICWNTA